MSLDERLRQIKEDYLTDKIGIDGTLLNAYWLGKKDGRASMEELMPCPFCGKGGESIVKKEHDSGWFSLFCESCRSTGPVRETLRDARIAWNERELHDA